MAARSTSTIVDPTVPGGIRVEIGDDVIDGNSSRLTTPGASWSADHTPPRDHDQ